MLERGLADEALADREAIAQIAAPGCEPVGRGQSQLGRPVRTRLDDEERAVLGADGRRDLVHDQLRHRRKVTLPLEHPEMLARFVFSQSCSALRWVVSRRLAIIWLMLSFSSATSP